MAQSYQVHIFADEDLRLLHLWMLEPSYRAIIWHLQWIPFLILRVLIADDRRLEVFHAERHWPWEKEVMPIVICILMVQNSYSFGIKSILLTDANVNIISESMYM